MERKLWAMLKRTFDVKLDLPKGIDNLQLLC